MLGNSVNTQYCDNISSRLRPSSDWSSKSVLIQCLSTVSLVSALGKGKSLLSDGSVGREEVGQSPNLGSPWHSLELLWVTHEWDPRTFCSELVE